MIFIQHADHLVCVGVFCRESCLPQDTHLDVRACMVQENERDNIPFFPHMTGDKVTAAYL